MNTKNLIIEVARTIFLDEGFKKANIRDIANKAEVSTGAIYGYFENKEKLYEAAIGPLPKEYYHKYLKAIKKIHDSDFQETMNIIKKNHFAGIELFLDYIYADPIAWKLVVKGKGTSYHKHLDIIVTHEIEAFITYLDVLEKLGVDFIRPNENVIKVLISNLVKDMIEIIKLDLDRDEAFEYSKQIADFFFLGWAKLLQIKY